MDARPQVLDLRAYARVVSRRRWLILLTFATVVVSTAVVTWRLTPIYAAEASIEVLPSSLASTEAARMLESFFDPGRSIQTQVELIRSNAVLQRAAKELGLASSAPIRGVGVNLVPNTQIVLIHAEHPRPDEAQAIANAVANAYISYRRDRALENSLAVSEIINKNIADVQAQIAELNQKTNLPSTASQLQAAASRLSGLQTQLQTLPDADDVTRGGGSIISPAELPGVPARPNKTLNLSLAALAGLILALGMAYLAENLDDRLKSPDELEERVGAPVLGYVPLVKEWRDKEKPTLAMDSDVGASAEEAYRTLLTNLRFVSLEKQLRTILVTSPVADVGKSTTAANLAATQAQGGEKVILLSADLRRPNVHKFFNLSNSLGLLQALDRRLPLTDALQIDQIPTLRLMAAGGIPPNPTEILDSVRFGEILASLSNISDVVIVDSPPVLGLGDVSALASQVDGILFVVQAGSVTNREISHAADQLKKAGGNIIGCVMNAVDSYEGYGYYYNYYYSHYTNTDGPSPNGKASSKDEPHLAAEA